MYCMHIYIHVLYTRHTFEFVLNNYKYQNNIAQYFMICKMFNKEVGSVYVYTVLEYCFGTGKKLTGIAVQFAIHKIRTCRKVLHKFKIHSNF